MNRGNWADWQEHIRKIESRERELLSKIENLSRELSVTKKLYAESCQASYDFGSLRAQLATETSRADAAVGDANDAERKLAERDALLGKLHSNLDLSLGGYREDIGRVLSASAEQVEMGHVHCTGHVDYAPVERDTLRIELAKALALLELAQEHCPKDLRYDIEDYLNDAQKKAPGDGG